MKVLLLSFFILLILSANEIISKEQKEIKKCLYVGEGCYWYIFREDGPAVPLLDNKTGDMIRCNCGSDQD